MRVLRPALPSRVNHGVTGYGQTLSAAVWEWSLGTGEYPALYAPRALETLDHGRPPRLGEAAR